MIGAGGIVNAGGFAAAAEAVIHLSVVRITALAIDLLSAAAAGGIASAGPLWLPAVQTVGIIFTGRPAAAVTGTYHIAVAALAVAGVVGPGPATRGAIAGYPLIGAGGIVNAGGFVAAEAVIHLSVVRITALAVDQLGAVTAGGIASAGPLRLPAEGAALVAGTGRWRARTKRGSNLVAVAALAITGVGAAAAVC